MNEEQADRLIERLTRICDSLKVIEQKLDNVIPQTDMNKSRFEALKDFKNQITSDEFFSTLNDEQKKFMVNLSPRPMRVMFKSK